MQNRIWSDLRRIKIGNAALFGLGLTAIGLMVSGVPGYGLAFAQDSAQLPARGAATQAPGEKISIAQQELIKKQAREAYGRLPITFVKNKGQINSKVHYYGESRGAKIYFTANEVVFAFAKPAAQQDSKQGLTPVAFSNKAVSIAEQNDRGMAISLEFLGADPKARAAGRDQQAGKANYFIGNDPAAWRTDLSTYREVAYKDLWPGVEAAFRDEGGSLKYEFRLQAGSRVEAVQLAYNGSESLSLDEAGNLLIKTPLGVLTDVKPTSYQVIAGRKVAVQSRFALRQGEDGRNIFGFEVAGHDPAYPLTIDPGLVYSTYVGGVSPDDAYGIQVDASGNAYVTGQTWSTEFPVTSGAFDTRYGGADAFVLKLNATGSAFAYATFLGGNGNDIGEAIAVDASGNAYVAISTSSSDMPVTSGVFQPVLRGSHNAYVAKLNATGKRLQLGTYLGGSNYDDVQGIALDNGANVYLAGYTMSVDFPMSNFPFDSIANGGRDAYVTKLNAALSALSYSTYLGGSGDDLASGLAVDGNGIAYVTGSTDSANFPTTAGAFDTSANGGTDFFVARVNPNAQRAASLIYSTYLGGSLLELSAGGIAVDGAGNAYVTGGTQSPDFPTTVGAFDTSFNGGTDDAFVSKLTASGNALVYSTFLGGSVYDRGRAIVVDAGGNAYIAGDTASPDYPVTPDTAFSATIGAPPDAFVSRLDPNGAGLLYSTFLGGNWADRAFALAVDGQGNIYVTGHTGSSDFPATPGAFDTSYNDAADVFISKLAPVIPGPDLVITAISGPSQAVRGTTITANLTVKNQGTQGTAFFQNAFYLSEFPTLTGWYVLLDYQGVPNGLAAGAIYSDTFTRLTIPATSMTGNLYLVAKADRAEAIAESNESNNTKAQQISITKK